MFFLTGSAEAVHLDSSLLVVMVLFIIYHILMKVLFYKPFFSIIQKRDALTTGKMQEALRTEQEYTELVDKYEMAVREARQKGYALIEESRRAAIEEQNMKIAQIQDEVKEKVESAMEEIKKSLVIEKKNLDTQIADLGRLIASAILAREIK